MGFQDFENFFILTGTGAATLAGLLYLGLSSAVGMLGKDANKAIRMWAEPRLDDFLQALVVSALALMLTLDTRVLATLLILVVIWRVKRLVEAVAYLKTLPDLEFSDWFEMIYGPGLTFAAALVGSVGLFFNWTWAPLLIALHVLSLLVLGVKNTWSQLSWMTVQRHQQTSKVRKRKR
jgi:hypothetical protein